MDHELFSIPEGVCDAAAGLRGRRGVVGVFWGQGRTSGEWSRDGQICVQVVEKLSDEVLSDAERLPRRIGRYRVDVEEVGIPMLDSDPCRSSRLDPMDTCRDGSWRRFSTISAMSGDLVLVSGHACLPLDEDGKRFVRAYAWGGGDAVPVYVVDRQTQCIHNARLEQGSFGDRGAVDWAVARLDEAYVDRVNAFHVGVGHVPPFRVRTTRLVRGESLSHFSTTLSTPGFVSGTYRRVVTRETSMRLGSPDGSWAWYRDVLAIAWGERLPFSRPGDSGSLVVDSDARVVGTVLGSSARSRESFVLPVTELRSRMQRDQYAQFFKE